jgi:hypothetical protein
MNIRLQQEGKRTHGASRTKSAPGEVAFLAFRSPSPDTPTCRFFPQTGPAVSGDFLIYWQAHGDQAQFGYPLTAVRWDQLEDGHWYQVQYFERARFEYHPENQAPYNVLLGQFGQRALATRPP